MLVAYKHIKNKDDIALTSMPNYSPLCIYRYLPSVELILVRILFLIFMDIQGLMIKDLDSIQPYNAMILYGKKEY